MTNRIETLLHEHDSERNQIVIKGDETAEERDDYEPEEAVISSGSQGHAKQIKLSKKSGKWRQASEGEHEDRHRRSGHGRSARQARKILEIITAGFVLYKTDNGERFSARTTSQSVNRHGALFQLEEIVVVGQTVILVNDHTSQSMECRVVSIHRARDGKQYVGVEFLSPETNFWHMQFPIPGAKPLRRVLPNKASA